MIFSKIKMQHLKYKTSDKLLILLNYETTNVATRCIMLHLNYSTGNR